MFNGVHALGEVCGVGVRSIIIVHVNSEED